VLILRGHSNKVFLSLGGPVAMTTRPSVLTVCLLVGATLPAAAAEPGDSAVKVIASVRYPNPIRPWAKGNSAETIGTGVVIDGGRVLTSAHLVLYATEVHVQGRPGGDKVEAAVQALGPDVDLAVLTVKDDKFFRQRPALPRSRRLPKVQDAVTVYGFPIGGNDLSVTKGVVSRIDFGAYGARGAGMVIQVSAAINPGNSGGPAVVDGRMVGIVQSRVSEAENIGSIIPVEEIDLFLGNIQDGRYAGKPVEAAGTGFQRLENPALRRMLKVGPAVKGALVQPPERPDPCYPLRAFDVLTRIGDHAIDNEGMVQQENGTRVPFLLLIPKLARGDAVPVTVLRGGREVPVALPVTRRDNRLLREYEGEPIAYFIHGPLVFSPANADAIPLYARMNPALCAPDCPLLTRRFDRVRFPGEELVVVTAPMFPHKITKGYGDPVGRVVREVNGVRIRNLRHLVETLRDCTDEYLTFRFADEWGDVMVFDRREMEKVTEEILEDNGIAASRRGSDDMLKTWKQKPAGAQ
jgi:S1-C subfamily serine protease